ncbi:acyl-CoA dehydrogenase family protein [Rhodococcus sp. NPDC003382]|uniref:acyl-CoA dehydrogenase family protein n=1 Tax=Rhodococcus zopfii TaxID=43772 RepID=UPI00093369D1|nr:acyl-CoA dehydrogenase family protein [Rhodococcus zopfii]
MNESNELLAAVHEAVEGVTKRWDRRYYLDCARENRAPIEMYKAMAEQGLFALGVPEEIGGAGGGLVATAAIMEQMSHAGTPPMLFSLTSFARQAVVRHGTPAQIERYVTPTLEAEQTFCFAITEPDAGTNSFEMRTFAHHDENGRYVLNGQKVFISGADQASHIMVVARTAPPNPANKTEGMSVFVLPRDTPGVTMQPMNIDWKAPERQFSVWFDNVTLPSDSLIGEAGHGLAAMFDSLNAERVVIAAWTLGLGRLALDKAVGYARARSPWGSPIGSYQAVSHPLAAAKAHLDAARAMTYRAAEGFDRGEDAADDANIAKYLASEASYRAIDAAIQTHGGSGFDEDTDIITLYPMIRILRVAPLNNEMILNYISRRMLGLPRSY